ncbi:DUF1015 domain-containing protein [Chloroflexota bacterium]
MAEIRPLRGVHYNQSLVGDLAKVICPPYDIISSQLQEELYHRSEHNFIRLEHNRELPQDTAKDNKYTRVAATLGQWLQQGILTIDEVPTIYLHDHHFSHQGRKYRRRGITVCVRLEEWDKMVIRPHEGTLSEPRTDRLNLLRVCQTNTSPVLVLFEDQGQQVASLLTDQEHRQPVMSINGANEDSHYVWAITEPEVINQIRHSLAHQPLYIADGHHRYQSALTYQLQQMAGSSPVSGDEAFNFIMMTLVDIADPGLIILPAHRLVRGISKSTLNELMPKLEAFFEVDELPLSIPDIWQQVDGLLVGKANQVRLALFGLIPESLLVLKLRDFNTASRMIPYFHSELYKKLDVSILDHIILEKMLGVIGEGEKANLAYSYDRLDAVSRVLDQEYQLLFLLSPTKSEMVKAIADAGDRMPRKSTYFYPKLPAGLVCYRLV